MFNDHRPSAARALHPVPVKQATVPRIAMTANRGGHLVAAALMLALAPALVVASPQAWTADPLEPITPDSEGDFSRNPDPIVLVVPRNGTASAQVVIRDADPEAIELGQLSSPEATFPAAKLRVRFAAHELPGHDWSHQRFDALLDEPPVAAVGEGDMLPVWVTAEVPADTAPGTYHGELDVDGLTVPVHLKVADFTLPDPQDWVSHAGLLQSPEAVAWTWALDLWSEAHFDHLKPSFKLLGALGNNIVHVTVERGLHLGNDHGMLIFRREGDRVRPDFRFVERYLELYDEHVGPPAVVNLYLWEPQQNPRHQDTEQISISFIDDDGTLSEGELPIYGRGEADDLWHEVIEGMRQRITDLGWDPDSLMIGVGHDRKPGESKVDFFNEMEPPLQWVVFSHWRGDPVRSDIDELIIDSGINVGYGESPNPMYNHSDFEDRTRLGGGWQPQYEVLWASSFRSGNIRRNAPLVNYRWMPDLTVIDRFAGFTRVGLDGWAAPHPESGERTPTIMRQRRGWYRLFRHNVRSIVAPGPAGAVATVRYEMLREGIQEAEARILLEQALASQKLSEEHRDEIETFLRDRIKQRYWQGKGRQRLTLTAPRDWQDATLELFEWAGLAAREGGLTADDGNR